MEDINGICRVNNDVTIEFRNDNIDAICAMNFKQGDLYSYCPVAGGRIRLCNKTMRMYLPRDVFIQYFVVPHIEKEG